MLNNITTSKKKKLLIAIKGESKLCMLCQAKEFLTMKPA